MKAFTIPSHRDTSSRAGGAAGNTGFALHKGRVRSVEGDRRGLEIDCREGCVWVTQQNGGDDIILRGGEHFRVTQPGRVVIEALEEAFVSAA